MTPLRQRFIDDLRLRNRAPKTIRAYVSQVARFARHCGRSPAELNAEDVRAYLLQLVGEHTSWSSYNQCTSALRFLYRTTLGREEFSQRLPFGRRQKRLPVTLTRVEVRSILAHIGNRKYRMVLATMYATGMRIGEATRLEVRDIDSRRMTIRVAQGKGNQQRLVPLLPELLHELHELRLWWQVHRNPCWLFPGRRRPNGPLDPSAVQRAFHAAVQSSGLNKHATTHSLRHTFATELLESGVSLTVIQKIMGHASLATTGIYTHVRTDELAAAATARGPLPLDQLCRLE